VRSAAWVDTLCPPSPPAEPQPAATAAIANSPASCRCLVIEGRTRRATKSFPARPARSENGPARL